jgi:hypothetical protein
VEVHGLQRQNLYIALGAAKLVARLFATEALWVRLQTSLENTKWATYANEWRTHSSPAKNIQKAQPGECVCEYYLISKQTNNPL